MFVPWSQLAPDATSTVRPAGFDASNPNDYSAAAWAPFDELVRSVAARGLSIMLTPKPYPEPRRV